MNEGKELSSTRIMTSCLVPSLGASGKAVYIDGVATGKGE